MSATLETPIFDAIRSEVRQVLAEQLSGTIVGVRGLLMTARGLPVPVGARCTVQTRRHGPLLAEVVALEAGAVVLSAFGEPLGVAPGDRVTCDSGPPTVPVGHELLGRVIDAEGRPLDGRPAPLLNRRYPLHRDGPRALDRRPIDAPLGLGVRAIDCLLTAGRGQRLGIFSGTGVGKSTLMGTVCHHTQADVNVVALVGERGREVVDFVRTQLDAGAAKRTVVVVCTSDAAATLRVRACFHATAIAEFFRDQGLDVLLLVDSLTRFAMAQRQVGLAAGEPPTVKGYPPSVFGLLPRMLERAGRTKNGSITGIYTVLVEGDDLDEPLSDAARGILDGHIWLSRSLASRGHYPAIDILNSISRVAGDVVSAEVAQAAQLVRRVLATWSDIEDLVNIGAYVPGTNPQHDVAVQTRELVVAFLQQNGADATSLADAQQSLLQLAEVIRAREAAATARRGGAG